MKYSKQNVALQKLTEKTFKKSGRCLHIEKGVVCNLPAIGSHSISEKHLSKISEDGHVFSYYGKPTTTTHNVFLKNVVCNDLIKTGVGEAGVFYGFCEEHDTRNFRSFEVRDFCRANEQIYWLSYRTIVYHIYGLSKRIQFLLKSDLHINDGRDLTCKVKSCERDKNFLEEELKRGYSSGETNMSFMHYNYAGDLPFSTSLCFRITQDNNKLDKLVSLNVFSDNMGGHILFSWTRVSFEEDREIIRGIKGCHLELGVFWDTFSFSLERTDNVYFNKTWFDALTPEIQEAVKHSQEAL